MKIEIKVPAMGESITEATVGEIIKPSGSVVEMDEEILELETDKVNQVLFAPKKGTLNLSVKTDDVVKIDQVIGFVDTNQVEKQQAEEPKQEKPEEKQEEKREKEQEEEKERDKAIKYTQEDFIQDLRKKEELQPEPQKEELIKSPKEEVQPKTGKKETRRRMTKIRRVIAERLVEAKNTTAMLTTFNEVDMSSVNKLREKYKDAFVAKHGVKLGLMAFFVKASVSALKAFPDLNTYIDQEDIVYREYYDIGIAVGSDRGLVVPVVKDCDQLSFSEIEKAIQTYAKKAKDGQMQVEDLQGGGFTITNGGVYGSLLSTPILNPPQSAILGMHKIEKRPVVTEDVVQIKPMMYLALSYDHRVVDGKEAVSFLVHIKNCIEDPTRLALEI